VPRARQPWWVGKQRGFSFNGHRLTVNCRSSKPNVAR
jgi:hypothetical protein